MTGDATASPLVLRAQGFGKRYGKTQAVQGLDLEVRRGEIFGLIGPDGAGKSSLMKAAAGVLMWIPGSIVFLLPLMVIGLLYVVVFYIAGNSIPVMKDLTNLENVGIGFGLMSIGFYLATRWK